MERAKILVVDDDADVVETIRFRLEQEGYEVSTAANGWEALGAVRTMVPDLVVLDVLLPQENGYRVSRFIKDDVKHGVYGKQIAVLLLTGRVITEPDRIRMFMEFSQADHMMYKPFELEAFVNKVKELLTRETGEGDG